MTPSVPAEDQHAPVPGANWWVLSADTRGCAKSVGSPRNLPAPGQLSAASAAWRLWRARRRRDRTVATLTCCWAASAEGFTPSSG
jgi:hypothetical protein